MKEYRKIKVSNILTSPFNSDTMLFKVDIGKDVNINKGENIQFYNEYMKVKLRRVLEIDSDDNRCFEAEYWIVEYNDKIK